DGLVPANRAIARSLIVPAVKMLQDYSSAKFHTRLKQLGFKTFTKPTTHYGLSLILGGGEATLWEVAAAYSSMGRSLINYSNTRDKYSPDNYRPLVYLRSDVVKNKNATQNTDLLSASSIWYTFNAMTELLRPQDYVGWMQFLSKNRIAWKTGTSFGFRDAWAVGLNSKYTVAVWVGNADGEGRPELTGTAAAAPLLFSIFNVLPNKTWFNKPTGDVEKINVCKQSGFKASEVCKDVEVKYYQKGCNKTKQCPYHKLIHLDETEHYRVNSNCYSVDKMKHVAWFVVSPTQEYFFKQHSLFYKPLPAYLPGCESDMAIHQMDIVYPREGFKIYVPVDQSGKQSNCIFKAAHKNPAVTIYWHMDGAYIGSTQKFHQLSLQPYKGMHVLELTDDTGESVKCKFEVIDK
ncbi:MAG: penicillin-binding protein 1C, partial [Bacteroidetes bacterium]|nr:penicillin-binding protein 1C [Bacteroidota bacterium]